jgi:hypothetical protein
MPEREQPSVEALREYIHHWARLQSQSGQDKAEAALDSLTAALEARRWNDSLLRDAIRELRDPNGLSREDIAGSLERDMKNV